MTMSRACGHPELLGSSDWSQVGYMLWWVAPICLAMLTSAVGKAWIPIKKKWIDLSPIFGPSLWLQLRYHI